MGEAAWWLPRWLDRVLPHMDIEGESAALPASSGTEAPVHVLGLGRTEAEARAEALLERVGLGDKLRARPRNAADIMPSLKLKQERLVGHARF